MRYLWLLFLVGCSSSRPMEITHCSEECADFDLNGNDASRGGGPTCIWTRPHSSTLYLDRMECEMDAQ